MDKNLTVEITYNMKPLLKFLKWAIKKVDQLKRRKHFN